MPEHRRPDRRKCVLTSARRKQACPGGQKISPGCHSGRAVLQDTAYWIKEYPGGVRRVLASTATTAACMASPTVPTPQASGLIPGTSAEAPWGCCPLCASRFAGTWVSQAGLSQGRLRKPVSAVLDMAPVMMSSPPAHIPIAGEAGEQPSVPACACSAWQNQGMAVSMTKCLTPAPGAARQPPLQLCCLLADRAWQCCGSTPGLTHLWKMTPAVSGCVNWIYVKKTGFSYTPYRSSQMWTGWCHQHHHHPLVTAEDTASESVSNLSQATQPGHGARSILSLSTTHSFLQSWFK
nr:uncharacterized protein LOC112429185 isoform X2 [Macaca nemestrina]